MTLKKNIGMSGIALAVLLAIGASPRTSASSASSCLTVTTVESFDVTEYAAAPWYVQRQAVNAYTPSDQNRCVTAQYEIRNDADRDWWERSWWGYTVDVFNYAETAAGDDSGGGLCADYDEETPSQLRVAPCFLPQLFAGPYWVVSYREGSDDGYALVSGGQPSDEVEGETDCGPDGIDGCCKTGEGINRSGLWILTRRRNAPDSLVEEVLTIAKRKGFSTSGLFAVTHDSDCRVPGIDHDDDEESTNTRALRHTARTESLIAEENRN